LFLRRAAETHSSDFRGSAHVIFPKRKIVSYAKFIVHLRPLEVHDGSFDPLPRQYRPALHIGSLDFFHGRYKSYRD
jgi:hypothetical protein